MQEEQDTAKRTGEQNYYIGEAREEQEGWRSFIQKHPTPYSPPHPPHLSHPIRAAGTSGVGQPARRSIQADRTWCMSDHCQPLYGGWHRPATASNAPAMMPPTLSCSLHRIGAAYFRELLASRSFHYQSF